MTTEGVAAAACHEVAVSFDSGPPHDTCWIAMEYPEGKAPKLLLTALAGIGFTPPEAQLPPLEGKVTLTLTKEGTDLFGGWTDAERPRFLAEARRVLRQFGFVNVPRNRRRAQDFL